MPRARCGERDGRAADGVGDGGERASVLGQHPFTELHERACVEHHQLVVGRLAEYARHGGAIELGQLRGAPWPLSMGAVPQGGRDRAVAGQAVALAQCRKPARAEVDRVELEPERGSLLAIGQARWLVVVGGLVFPSGSATRVGRDRVVLDPHAASAFGHDRAHTPELVHGLTG